MNISRRAAVAVLASSFSGFPKASGLPGATCESVPRTSMGLVMYCCRYRRDHLKSGNSHLDLYQPQKFLEHCRDVGAGGMQVRLGVLSKADARALRDTAENADLYIEAIVSAPKAKQDLDRLSAELDTAAAVGAKAARTTIIPGRRYEYFDSLEMFRRYEAQGQASLELAAKVAEKRRVPIAVENHKDQRDDRRVALLEQISSEYVGACVDTGNSFALLEDPIETVRKLAPWAFSVHLKDQAVQLYDDGFLLGDIPLGQGFLDLKTIVGMLRKEKPGIRFSLELITRDPLKVPVLKKEYWVTMPEVTAAELARTLRYVREGATDNLQYVSKMTPAERLVREDENVAQSIQYARAELGLT